MINEIVNAFLLVFAAEMGDKSQIIAMTFAAQHKKKDVLLGICIAAILNHGLAIALGRYLSKIIPLNLIQVVSGFIFIIFGLMSLRDEEVDGFKVEKSFCPISTIAIAFFVSELGDKTQLTAMTLASEASFPLLILIGTSSAMVSSSALSVIIGSKIGDRIPDILIKVISSIVFITFGFFKLYDVVPTRYLSTLNSLILIGVILCIEIYLVWRLVDNRRGYISPMKEAAKNLFIQTEALKQSLDSICLGNDICGTCSENSCLIGYIRFILKEARENETFYKDFSVDINKFIKKEYDKKQIIKSLGLILSDYHKYQWEDNDDFVVQKVKYALEILLFGEPVNETKNIGEYIKMANKIDKKVGKLLEDEIQYNLN